MTADRPATEPRTAVEALRQAKGEHFTDEDGEAGYRLFDAEDTLARLEADGWRLVRAEAAEGAAPQAEGLEGRLPARGKMDADEWPRDVGASGAVAETCQEVPTMADDTRPTPCDDNQGGLRAEPCPRPAEWVYVTPSGDRSILCTGHKDFYLSLVPGASAEPL